MSGAQVLAFQNSRNVLQLSSKYRTKEYRTTFEVQLFEHMTNSQGYS